MRDCDNVEIRDRLPDLLHEGLDASTRRGVLAHVADCADCAAELELLGGVRRVAIAATPAVDVERILAVIGLPVHGAREAPARGSRPIWGRRVGAVASLALAAGLGAIVLLRENIVPAPTGSSNVAGAVEQAVVVPGPSGPAPVAPSEAPVRTEPPAKRELAVGAGLGDVSDGALVALLSEIESLGAQPDVEPDEPLPTPSRGTEAPGGGGSR